MQNYKTCGPPEQCGNVYTIILGKSNFKTKQKCLFFKSWIASIFLVVKDLFEPDGKWISAERVLNRLQNKCNWVSEFYILKNVVFKIVTKHADPLMCHFIQKSCLQNIYFASLHGFIDLKKVTTKEMYSILIEKKIKRPYTENMWQKN